jgi:glucosylglycerol-phosphate synthase
MELEDALLVNPFSRSSLDDTLDQAIDMPAPEQRERMGRLYEQVRRYDIRYWTQHVLRSFAKLAGAAPQAADDGADAGADAAATAPALSR